MKNKIRHLYEISRDRGGIWNVLRRFVSQPRIVAQALVNIVQSDWRAVVIGSSKYSDELRNEIRELGLVSKLNTRLQDAFAALRGTEVRGRPAVPGGMRPLHAEVLWQLVRARKPKKVVETGVCNGLSSALLLEALAMNGGGELISVDLPEFTDPGQNSFEVWEGKGGAAIPAGRKVGWLVREELRASWRLELGRSQEILKPLLREVAPIDIFIHDSEHSYENQIFEFRSGFEVLKPGGVLVATDITWSSAFDDFWSEIRGTGAKRVYVDPSCALVVKAG